MAVDWEDEELLLPGRRTAACYQEDEEWYARSDAQEALVSEMLAVANHGRRAPAAVGQERGDDDAGSMWNVCPGGAFLFVGHLEALPDSLGAYTPLEFCKDLRASTSRPKAVQEPPCRYLWGRGGTFPPPELPMCQVFRLPTGASVAQRGSMSEVEHPTYDLVPVVPADPSLAAFNVLVFEVDESRSRLSDGGALGQWLEEEAQRAAEDRKDGAPSVANRLRHLERMRSEGRHLWLIAEAHGWGKPHRDVDPMIGVGTPFNIVCAIPAVHVDQRWLPALCTEAGGAVDGR